MSKRWARIPEEENEGREGEEDQERRQEVERENKEKEEKMAADREKERQRQAARFDNSIDGKDLRLGPNWIFWFQIGLRINWKFFKDRLN